MRRIRTPMNVILREKIGRIKFVFMFNIFIIVLIIIFYWKIQIVKYSYYLERAKNNIAKEEKIPAPRGIIKSADGRVIADNKVSFNVYLSVSKLSLSEFNLRRLSRILNIPQNEIKKRAKKNFYLGKSLIEEDVDFRTASLLFSERDKITGLQIKVFPRREYPKGEILSHITGYVGEVSLKELRERGYLEMGDYIGRTGIERYYDSLLFGKKGIFLNIVNSRGHTVKVIKKVLPISGQRLHLTINYKLQKTIYDELKRLGYQGSIVVMRPDTGEVLVLISSPVYNPNIFLNKNKKLEVKKILQMKESPLLNKVITGLYSPGSVFKLLVGIAGLSEKVTSPTRTVFCSGLKEFYGKMFHCWFEGGHGNVNIYEAIEKSCNIYFYQIGKELGIDNIEKYAKMFGFGELTGIDLPFEKRGIVPGKDWKRKNFGVEWFPGETISVAIGQGPMLVTPIQVARFISAIATMGNLPTPHVLDYYFEEDGRRVFYKPKVLKLNLRKKVFETIIEGMSRVVNGDGTGKLARVKGVEVCGKTGTVQIVSKETLKLKVKNEKLKRWATHAWFAGFAPRKKPEIVVVVMLEHSGAGGEVAAPFAGFIFKKYFELKRKGFL